MYNWWKNDAWKGIYSILLLIGMDM
jgi:hypothetical protein